MFGNIGHVLIFQMTNLRLFYPPPNKQFTIFNI